MPQENKPQKQNLGLIYFLLVVLLVWTLIQSFQLAKVDDKVHEILLDDPYAWDCSQWYGDCQELVFDNESGYFITKGYIDPSCEGWCAWRTLHKREELRELDMNDFLEGD